MKKRISGYLALFGSVTFGILALTWLVPVGYTKLVAVANSMWVAGKSNFDAFMVFKDSDPVGAGMVMLVASAVFAVVAFLCLKEWSAQGVSHDRGPADDEGHGTSHPRHVHAEHAS